jgi:hypothetical protein
MGNLFKENEYTRKMAEIQEVSTINAVIQRSGRSNARHHNERSDVKPTELIVITRSDSDVVIHSFFVLGGFGMDCRVDPKRSPRNDGWDCNWVPTESERRRCSVGAPLDHTKLNRHIHDLIPHFYHLVSCCDCGL